MGVAWGAPLRPTVHRLVVHRIMPAGPDSIRRVLRRYRVQLFLRLAALVTTAAAAAVWAAAGRGTLGVLAGALALTQLPGLVRFVERPARDLLRFLEGVRNDDLSVGFGSEGQGPLLDALRGAFTEVSEAFRRVRSEREEQAHYLQTVVRHVGVALVAFRDDGGVALFNEAAGRLLGLRRPRTLGAIEARHPALASALQEARTGGRELVEVERDDQPLTLVVHATRFQIGGAFYTLASLQDIRPELEEKEIEAWQQLTRVLTHEIMNSVTPIASLAATASDLLRDGKGDGAPAAGGVAEALRVIERRCDGLVHFVEAYRSLARLPKPQFRIVKAADLLGGVHALLRATAAERGVALRLEVEPPGLELVADPDLVEQALVNIVLNAIQAAEGRPGAQAVLRARSGPFGRPVVEVTDNGPGLLPEVRDKIFVPFFTTKPDGSGIGLSLARQIARLHGGSLTVHSKPDVATTFAFRF
jgi:two-component system, NtrC family, nitrogen regulation sensor histidine kinase NtrY